MLTAYLEAAMRSAHYELLPEDGQYYGEIPQCNGVSNCTRKQILIFSCIQYIGYKREIRVGY